MNLNRAIETGIAGLVPVYEPSLGNVTRLITIPGEEMIINKTVKSVMRRVACHYGIDIKAIKTNYSRVIGHYKGIPVPMTPELVFISVKVREPIVRGDGGLAYINLHCIKSYRSNGSNVNILFNNGISLKGLCSITTFKKHMRWGNLVHSLHTKNSRPRHYMILEDVSESYAEPATRADIALIVREILELKERLP